MRIVKLQINNFRGIKEGYLFFPGHTVLVGDNNTSKSTILEAIDLVLGPERLSRRPVIDEHDFYAGRYLDEEKKPVEIFVEAVLIEYYAFRGKKLLEIPRLTQDRPAREYLRWHNEEVYLG